MDKKNLFSFEFFPTKTEAGSDKLLNNALLLSQTCHPSFFSCTYGAGGSTKDRTLDTIRTLNTKTNVATAPHLSCIGDTKESLRALLQLYKTEGVTRIVALRGDLPSGMGITSGELRYASDLVSFIREEMGEHFHIEVAAYPEVHPQAINMKQDLQHFVNKVKSGAHSAITQYFFNADSYFYFVDQAQKNGVDIPIIPGIMPITNYSKLARFSDACGAELPRWIRKQLEAYGDESKDIQSFGTEVISNLCQQLLDGGAPGLHFYTLNQAEPTLAVWRNLI